MVRPSSCVLTLVRRFQASYSYWNVPSSARLPLSSCVTVLEVESKVVS
jgi:hypothetical protein